MVVNNVSLEISAVSESQYPSNNLCEIAFAGKSNVGKSSLINCMVNRKSLARTSQAPGKTRTLNFYNVENKLYFVDLPGYGYAKVSKSESQKWGKMIESYLLNRKQLGAIVLLIDIRHNPGENDFLMYDWLKYYKHDIIVAATKSDKLKRSQIQKHLSAIRNSLDISSDSIVLPFSSRTKQGMDELWQVIEKKAFQ